MAETQKKPAAKTTPAPATPPEAPKVAQAPGAEPQVVARDAGTGQFVDEQTAAENPDTTIHQTITPTVELSQAFEDVLDTVDEITEGSVGTLVGLASAHAASYEYSPSGAARLRRDAIVTAAARLIKAIELLDDERADEAEAGPTS